jgi:hypothetical protein
MRWLGNLKIIFDGTIFHEKNIDRPCLVEIKAASQAGCDMANIWFGSQE